MDILRDENLENWLIKPRMVGADYHFLLGRAWLSMVPQPNFKLL